MTRLVLYDEQCLPLAINYTRIPLYLVEVAKHQRDEIASLKADNESSRSRLDRLEAAVDKLNTGKRTATPADGVQAHP